MSKENLDEEGESLPMKLLRQIGAFGIDGCMILSSAKQLANEYRHDIAYDDDEARIKSLIRWECSKTFAEGFVTGLGGLLTLPVAIPASLGASWIIQARLAATIAELYGHDCKEDRVRTLATLCLLGDGIKEVLKGVGIQVGNKLGGQLLKQIPGKIFIEINKKVGFRLITKAGEKGVINVIKLVPIIGGFVGGTIDLAATRTVGRVAKELFAPSATSRKSRS
jgi:uncharacterized protein (DUF697 family)